MSVCDYKPDLTPEISSAISDNFINSIPQIAIYALLVLDSFDLEGNAIIWNKEGTYEFDPKELLNEINNLMQRRANG